MLLLGAFLALTRTKLNWNKMDFAPEQENFICNFKPNSHMKRFVCFSDIDTLSPAIQPWPQGTNNRAPTALWVSFGRRNAKIPQIRHKRGQLWTHWQLNRRLNPWVATLLAKLHLYIVSTASAGFRNNCVFTEESINIGIPIDVDMLKATRSGPHL